MTPTPPVGPTIHPTAYICPGAVLIGQVSVEAGCFIGPNAVLRGDIEPVVVKRGANVQDNCTLHTHEGNPVTIGENASVGHGAVVHGATVEADALIGMNAVVLDNAVVGQKSVIGAMALVPEGFRVPPSSLAVGVPCKVVKEGDDRIGKMAYENSRRYHDYRDDYRTGRWEWVQR